MWSLVVQLFRRIQPSWSAVSWLQADGEFGRVGNEESIRTHDTHSSWWWRGFERYNACCTHWRVVSDWSNHDWIWCWYIRQVSKIVHSKFFLWISRSPNSWPSSRHNFETSSKRSKMKLDCQVSSESFNEDSIAEEFHDISMSILCVSFVQTHNLCFILISYPRLHVPNSEPHQFGVRWTLI